MQMNLSRQVAKQFRDVHFGGNWTAVNLKETLVDLKWKQAVAVVQDLNSIAVLLYHMNYYVSEVLKVLKGEPLTASDKLSFDMPAITSQMEWEALVAKVFVDAESFASHIEALDDRQLFQDFANPKYGNYYRNLHGIIEHTHYHLGQIILIKKIMGGDW